MGYHQDTHLGARGALRTLRAVSWDEKAVDKARKCMGKPACTYSTRFPMFQRGGNSACEALSLALPSREMCVPATALALSLRPLTVLVRPLRSAGRRYELSVHGDVM